MSSPIAIINELEEALSNGSSERRISTLHRITDLFVFGCGRFSDDHVALFDSVLSRLIADIKVTARAALADRLAAIPNAPPTVIRILAFDDAIDVAGPVLTQSERLDNATLVENANTKSQRHLLAISRRKALAETVTDVLVERGDRDVALSAVQNVGAQFSEAGYIRLVKRSAGDDELTQSVGSRPEIPRHHFVKLLAVASKAVRVALEATHPQNTREIQNVVANVATAIQAKAIAGSRDYAAARALVESSRAAGRLNDGAIEAFARAGKFEETTAALAVLSELPIEVIERAIVQDRAEIILVIAKAVGLSWLAAKAVLMLAPNRRRMSAQALEQCMVGFARLKRGTAQQVIDFQRKRHGTGSFFVG
jgi:uncharacterized protein (DUF2336 family)